MGGRGVCKILCGNDRENNWSRAQVLGISDGKQYLDHCTPKVQKCPPPPPPSPIDFYCAPCISSDCTPSPSGHSQNQRNLCQYLFYANKKLHHPVSI